MEALCHLLQGLPCHLSEQEALALQQALPESVQGSKVAEPAESERSNPPSLIHRITASTMILFCLALRLLLPYLKYLISAVFRYERTYHISEKAFAMGISTADSLGKKAIDLASSALGNEMITETVAYCVDGVCGGLTEGLGEGIRVIEAPHR